MMPRGTHCMQSINVMAMRMFNLLKVRLYGQDRTKCQGDNCCIGAVITGKAVIKAACSTKVQLPRHLEREKKNPLTTSGPFSSLWYALFSFSGTETKISDIWRVVKKSLECMASWCFERLWDNSWRWRKWTRRESRTTPHVSMKPSCFFFFFFFQASIQNRKSFIHSFYRFPRRPPGGLPPTPPLRDTTVKRFIIEYDY